MIPIVFINTRRYAFVDDIIRGNKVYETRSRNMLGGLVGHRVLIAETGHGKPVVRCSATISDMMTIDNPYDWENMRKLTRVPEGSEYDWKPETQKKYMYRLTNVRELDCPFTPAEDIRHGRVWMEYHPDPYETVWDGDSFTDGQTHGSLESAIVDAQETLILWMQETVEGWKFDENGIPIPTAEQIEDWDYMIYNMMAYVVPFDNETCEYASLDDAVWPRTDDDTDKLGWMIWEECVKHFRKEDAE